MKDKFLKFCKQFKYSMGSLVLIAILLFFAKFDKNSELSSKNEIVNKDEAPIKAEFKAIFPTTKKNQKHGDFYYCYDKDGKLLGMIVETTNFAFGINGFGGEIPLFIVLDQNKVIQSVVAGEHSEAEPYFGVIEKSRLLEKWNKLTLLEAEDLVVETVTGATKSSSAIIETMELTLMTLNSTDN